jgi:DNA-binding LytR/AlgR family response regulator
MLMEYESIISDYEFMRVYKSYLVNMKFVSPIDRDGFLWLNNGESIPVSGRRKEEVMALLKER